jgi:hypothetical protein
MGGEGRSEQCSGRERNSIHKNMMYRQEIKGGIFEPDEIFGRTCWGVYSKLGEGGVRRLVSMSLHCEEYFTNRV